MKNPYTILKHPISTEKIVRLVELENKLLFVVDMKATKKDIKKAFEDAFEVKVNKVNTFVTNRGEKRAYISLSKNNPAIDVMTKLGLM